MNLTRNLSVFCVCALLVFGFLAISIDVDAEAGTPMSVVVPEGLPPVPVPADNPMTVEKVELGKLLYFDTRLSKDKTLSCATCHIPENGYAEPLPVSVGINEQLGPINSPPVINSGYATSMFWDGRMKTLEEQAAGPIENPIEMGHQIADVAKELNSIPEYQKRFHEVFGKPASKDTITKAIAAFERTLVCGNSDYDKYMAGDKSALSDDAIKGYELFKGKGLCYSCHTPPIFSNWQFFNAGVEIKDGIIPDGRKSVSNLDSDLGAFRVPHLRGLDKTAPYLHDGSAKKLKDAVRLMAKGGNANAKLHPLFAAIKAQNITDKEIDQLTAFVLSLAGEYPVIQEPKLP